MTANSNRGRDRVLPTIDPEMIILSYETEIRAPQTFRSIECTIYLSENFSDNNWFV